MKIEEGDDFWETPSTAPMPGTLQAVRQTTGSEHALLSSLS